MGKRLRLAQLLADGMLDGKELEEALENKVIVQQSETIKRDRKKKEMIKREVVKDGR